MNLISFIWTILIIHNLRNVLSNDLQNEEMGLFPKKEHSLIIPFQGSGIMMPFWDMFGNTVASVNYIRLTSDTQGLHGGICNVVPIKFVNWEVRLHFKIHGKSKKWFGDGLAFWYLTDKLKPGPIFGGPDYFNGLAVFIDTYPNKNDVHDHGYPYISVMINNGTLHYDHAHDGHNSVISGCVAKVRDTNRDTHLLIQYDNDSVVVKVFVENQWQECFSLDGVLLPTNGFIGVSASTGDLTDNHDIISLKVYELEIKSSQQIDNRGELIPTYLSYGIRKNNNSQNRLSNFSLFLIIFFTLIALIFLSALLYLYCQMKNEIHSKRFY